MFIFVSLMLLFIFVDAKAQQSTQRTVHFVHINPENGERTWKSATMEDYVANWKVSKEEWENLTTKFPIEGSITFKVKDDLLGKTNHFNLTEVERFAMLSKYVESDFFNGTNVALAGSELNEIGVNYSIGEEERAAAIQSSMQKIRNGGN